MRLTPFKKQKNSVMQKAKAARYIFRTCMNVYIIRVIAVFHMQT